MLEGFLHLFARRSFGNVLTDVADILLVAYVLYRALLVLRGTRAMQMGLGLGVIFVVYLVSKWADFTTLLYLLNALPIILIVVVVFQNDIRRGLMRVGARAFLAGLSRQQESRVIDEVVAAATELARHRMGALIAFEQDANLDEFVVAQGIPLESMVTRELLVSLFVPESVNKLHDGAVIIRNLRIAKAGVFFPMPESRIVDNSLGSRHRAALGITEETDAVVVVVSEERGTISFCFSGNIVSNLDGASLKQALLGLFGRKPRKKGGKKVMTPAGRPSYTSLPGRLSATPTPVPTSVGAAHSTPSTPPPPVAPSSSSSSSSDAPPAGPRTISEPMSSPEPDTAAPIETSESNELPESPPPKGRGASSPEEANEE